MSKGKEGEMEFSQKKDSPECLKPREFGEVLRYSSWTVWKDPARWLRDLIQPPVIRTQK